MTVSTSQAQTSVHAAAAAPKLGDGVELLGRYRGSGFKEPRYLARRADGQVVQLPPLLYHVAKGAAESRDYTTIAKRVGEAINRSISAGDVRFVVDQKLRPLGLAHDAESEPPPSPPKPDPLLGLKHKSALVPAQVVQVIAATFKPLFYPPVVLAVLAAVVALDIWLFRIHGVAEGLRAALYEPTTLLLVLGLVGLSAIFHECGHAAATRYGGAQPGAMGAGLYLVWPALYTDITDSYRLGRGGRLRADLGGVYFNALFMLLTAGAYFLTGFEPLLLMIPLQHLEIAHQLLPLLRLDGYYIVSDLTGVPDILSRVKPTLKSLVPGVETDARVKELKPWTRAVVTVYLLLLVPIVLLLFALMAFAAPRVLATAWDALAVTLHRAHEAIDRREAAVSLVSLIQIAILCLSPVALALTFARAARRVSGAFWRGTETRPRARAVVVAATSATVTALFVSWWINGAYRPVAAGERGTLSSRVFDVPAAVGQSPQHRPAVPQRRPSPQVTSGPHHSRMRPGNPTNAPTENGRTVDPEPAPAQATRPKTGAKPAATSADPTTSDTLPAPSIDPTPAPPATTETTPPTTTTTTTATTATTDTTTTTAGTTTAP